MASVKVDISWSPTEINRFITVGTDIQLYEVEDVKSSVKPPAVAISEYTCANVIGNSCDHQYLKCFSWYPKEDHPLLLAVGMSNGKVILESLDSSTRDAEIAGKELVPKPSRSCNCLAWNPVESHILASGFEKHRGEHCVLLWDITRTMYLPSALEAPFERRSVFHLDQSSISKPILELGISESTQSIHWFRNNPKLLVCGMSGKNLKLFDTRDVTKHHETTVSKAVYNLCVDPQVEHRLASSFENCFVLWDVRNFEKPVATITESKHILKLSWSPARSGLLAVLCKDSASINLYDIQSPPGNDEVEPAIVERNLQPFASRPIMSFSWHPTQENRMLTISQNNQILDYTVFDRITLNYSPTSEIIRTCGRKVLLCIDSRDEFYNCLDDISVKIRRRAVNNYGLKVPKLWMNAELAEDHSLDSVWMWLDFVRSSETERKWKGNPKISPKTEGVHSLICGENVHICSEAGKGAWIGIEFSHCKITKYLSPERLKVLQICGWSKDSDPIGFSKFLERLENDGHYARASAVALFNLEMRRAIEILSRGATSKNYKGQTDLNAIAMALAGYTENKSLWHEISGTLKRQLKDPHLRAMFAFLTDEDETYDDILNENQIAVQDRMAFASLYLQDQKLAVFLDGLKNKMVESGNLDGILLTGLSNDGLSLIQKYVDTTGDVQTASLIVLHTLPSKASSDPRAQAWVYAYRGLLDVWMLWKVRAAFDVLWFRSCPQAPRPPQQVHVSCNFCRRPVTCDLRSHFRPPMSVSSVNNSSSTTHSRFTQVQTHVPLNRKITCCPSCRKPMPRCSLCLSHMGTASGLNFLRETSNNPDRKKIADFSNWLTWCQSCRHGGHSGHILGWFQHHAECPVTGCSCKCMSLDANLRLSGS